MIIASFKGYPSFIYKWSLLNNIVYSGCEINKQLLCIFDIPFYAIGNDCFNICICVQSETFFANTYLPTCIIFLLVWLDVTLLSIHSKSRESVCFLSNDNVICLLKEEKEKYFTISSFFWGMCHWHWHSMSTILTSVVSFNNKW